MSAPNEEQVRNGRVTEVLLQHWAEMVNDQRAELNTAIDQITSLDERATRLYQEVIQIHTLYNESETELAWHIRSCRLMFTLLTTIFRENPDLPIHYSEQFIAAMDGTMENPIDLTTDEVLEVEL